MLLDYILLILVFFFPFIYKIWYWGSVFDAQEYGFLRSGEYLLSERGFPKIYHFWVYIEAPILAMSFLIFYNELFEVFIYNIMLYFLLLYNVFVYGKLLRRKFHFPQISYMFCITVLFICIVWAISILIHPKLIYAFIAWTMFLMPFYFLFIEALKKWVMYFLKRRKQEPTLQKNKKKKKKTI